MAITLKQAKELRVDQTLYHKYLQNADGTAQRWKVNGKVKTWKRRPEKVQIPIKRGLYEYSYLTEDILKLFYL